MGYKFSSWLVLLSFPGSCNCCDFVISLALCTRQNDDEILSSYSRKACVSCLANFLSSLNIRHSGVAVMLPDCLPEGPGCTGRISTDAKCLRPVYCTSCCTLKNTRGSKFREPFATASLVIISWFRDVTPLILSIVQKGHRRTPCDSNDKVDNCRSWQYRNVVFLK